MKYPIEQMINPIALKRPKLYATLAFLSAIGFTGLWVDDGWLTNLDGFNSFPAISGQCKGSLLFQKDNFSFNRLPPLEREAEIKIVKLLLLKVCHSL